MRHAEIRRLALALREAARALKANRAQLQTIVNDLVPGLTERRGIGPVSADFRAAIQPPSRRFASEASGVLVAQGAAVEPGDGEGLGQVGLAQDG